MSDSIKAAHEAEEAYEALCKHFGEQVQSRNGFSDCYGKHAQALHDRYHKELAALAAAPVKKGPSTAWERIMKDDE